MESHHTGGTDGDQAIACKIAIGLEIEQQGGEANAGAIVVGKIVIDSIHVFAYHVSHTYFHKVAPHHQFQAFYDIFVF